MRVPMQSAAVQVLIENAWPARLATGGSITLSFPKCKSGRLCECPNGTYACCPDGYECKCNGSVFGDAICRRP